MITLNPEQEECVKKAEIWFKTQHKQLFVIAGGAGRGKTTVVYSLIERLGLEQKNVLYCAYTGKAALVLTMKGNLAQTIHSAIMQLVNVPIKEHGEIKCDSRGKPITQLKFVKKDELDPDIKLIVVDEGSMVNEEYGKMLMSFGIPIIVLLDLNQLPPIFGKSLFSQAPDVELKQLMRQALDNPIVLLAEKALNREYIGYGQYGPDCNVIYDYQLTDQELLDADIILCGTNSTREYLNRRIRSGILHVDNEILTVGDKVICRKNSWETMLPISGYPLVNGMIGYITRADIETLTKDKMNVDFRPDFVDEVDMFSNLIIDPYYPFIPYRQKRSINSFQNTFDSRHKFEFGYAITVHLSQGSQYNNVVLFDEYMGDKDYYSKLLYTGITRAVKKLTIVKKGRW